MIEAGDLVRVKENIFRPLESYSYEGKIGLVVESSLDDDCNLQVMLKVLVDSEFRFLFDFEVEKI